jgi:hypothetical protein
MGMKLRSSRLWQAADLLPSHTRSKQGSAKNLKIAQNAEYRNCAFRLRIHSHEEVHSKLVCALSIVHPAKVTRGRPKIVRRWGDEKSVSRD